MKKDYQTYNQNIKRGSGTTGIQIADRPYLPHLRGKYKLLSSSSNINC